MRIYINTELQEDGVSAVGAGYSVAYDNLVTNPYNIIAQRGDYSSPVALADNTYYIDRNRGRLTGVTGTIQQVTSSQPTGVYGSNSIKCVSTSTASGIIGCVQPYFNYAKYAGDTLSNGVWVKSNSSDARVGFRTSDGYSMSSPHSGSGLWEWLSVTATMGSSITFLHFVFCIISDTGTNVSISTNDYIEYTSSSVLPGNSVIATKPRSCCYEEFLCQCVVEKTYDIDVVPGTNTEDGQILTSVFNNFIATGSSWQLGYHPFFKVKKLDTPSTPAITLYTQGGTSGQWYINGNKSCGTRAVGQCGFHITNTGSGVTPAEDYAFGHYFADFEDYTN